MANGKRKKRKTAEPDEHRAKRPKRSDPPLVPQNLSDEATAGRIKRIYVKNFMCHDALEIQLNKNVNFIVGRNGSGKSAILTALVVGLGAKANVTSRGSSVKEFIKKGKNSATVEITLMNEGPMAYKADVYGDSITISRTIGSTSGYKIKNANGKVISTKKNELERITAEMNIQVENPISILNQDVSRTFLVTGGPKEKYALFMKATHLDKIGENYKNAQILSNQAKHQLNESKERLEVAKKEINELKNNVRMLESIDDVRAEHDALKNELHWSIAISEERKLNQIQTSVEEHQNDVKNHEEEMRTREKEEAQIKTKIEGLNEKIQEIENEAVGSSDAYSAAKKSLTTKKEAHALKYREWISLQNRMKRMKNDIADLSEEIQRREADRNQVENERHQNKANLAKYEEELIKIEAVLHTKQTDQRQFESTKSQLIQEERDLKMELNQASKEINSKKRLLDALNQESDNAVTIFGANMPRLLKRIKEEYDKKRFTQMPRGPLGLHIKIKDPKWTAGVESFLGAGTLRSFCVDNLRDAKVLSNILEEVFENDHRPQIITSKFFFKVHDVSGNCTQAHGYKNLLEAMEISDPIVANCLIDVKEVESVLLIPTSHEASEMLSDRRKVPDNCKRAVTQQGDKFDPDPNYRSYGGKKNFKARLLQVSTTEAIKVLEEELHSAEADKTAIFEQYNQVHQKLKQIQIDLQEINTQVSKLRSRQNKVRAAINELRDKCEVDESHSVAALTNDLNDSMKRLKQASIEEAQLNKDVSKLNEEVRSSEVKVKRYRDLAHFLDTKLEPFKKAIREQENELQQIRDNSQYIEKRLVEARSALQKVTAEYEIQQRVAGKAVADAAKMCPRMSTQRSANRINHMIKELRANIESVEKQWGSKEALVAELEEKREKYDGMLEFANAIEKSNDIQLKRLESRRRLYHTMKNLIAKKVHNSFKSVLALRNYKGKLEIDHINKLLVLEVDPTGNAKRTTNDARSLSGGEKSYSTVAFILALWDCIELPFYFLDEFDVFMDKVNRRVIMDILLDHTRSHPAHQFAFLTPLDTSSILAEDYVTIHQLAPPERAPKSVQ